jgi:hypothetical protein
VNHFRPYEFRRSSPRPTYSKCIVRCVSMDGTVSERVLPINVAESGSLVAVRRTEASRSIAYLTPWYPVVNPEMRWRYLEPGVLSEHSQNGDKYPPPEGLRLLLSRRMPRGAPSIIGLRLLVSLPANAEQRRPPCNRRGRQCALLSCETMTMV